MAESDALCRRALDGCRALAASYDEVARALAALARPLDDPVATADAGDGIASVAAMLAAAEDELRPLLEPLAKLRALPSAELSRDACAVLAEVDALARGLAARHAELLRAALTARDVASDRLLAIARARATRVGYAGSAGRPARLASRIA